MTVSSALSSAISGSVSHSPIGQSAAAVAAKTASTGTGDSFGPAYVLDLSATAQDGTASSDAVASSSDATSSDSSGSDSNSSASSSTGSSPAGGAPPAGGGGGGSTTTSTTSEEVATEIAKAKREVAAQVGVVAANSLVDSKGNIDTIGLAEEIAKQQKANPAQQKDSTTPLVA